MEHSNRFTQAVTKLYNAFHKGELRASDCTKCAVGNICDNTSGWAYLSKSFGSGLLSENEEEIAIGIEFTHETGYSPLEIVTIEKVFLDGCEWNGFNYNNQDNQYRGLCAVIEYLCELEGIPKVMDYSKLFETENSEPKYKLESVLC